MKTRRAPSRNPVAPVGSGALITAVALGCGTKYAQTATQPNEPITADASSVAACGSTLASRLAVTTIDVDDDIRYKREGYNNVPTDARLAFHVVPSGNGYVAWANNALTTIHVTPLTALQTRLGPDVTIAGHEVGGIVAQNDGFTLLFQGDDPGTPLVNPNPNPKTPGLAAMVARYNLGSNAFAFVSPLTGTASIVNAASPLHDCTSEHFDSRLAFNGTKYGAYFTVHGCQGDGAGFEGYYADKLAYFDDQGLAIAGGWNWGCSISEDQRLVPESGDFTALCMTTDPSSGGLNLVRAGSNLLTLLSSEFIQPTNVIGAQFGSVMKLSDGSYAVFWLSRGGPNADNSLPAKPENDIAMMRLGPAPDYAPSPITWFNTPNVHEVNLHVAPYGSSRLLMSWDSVENFTCSRDFDITCLGQYTGTHFQLLDTQGNKIGSDEILPYPPNERDDMVTFPNNDVAWAFVPDRDRQYATTYSPTDVPQLSQVPPIRRISVARMLYCP